MQELSGNKANTFEDLLSPLKWGLFKPSVSENKLSFIYEITFCVYTSKYLLG